MATAHQDWTDSKQQHQSNHIQTSLLDLVIQRSSEHHEGSLKFQFTNLEKRISATDSTQLSRPTPRWVGGKQTPSLRLPLQHRRPLRLPLQHNHHTLFPPHLPQQTHVRSMLRPERYGSSRQPHSKRNLGKQQQPLANSQRPSHPLIPNSHPIHPTQPLRKNAPQTEYPNPSPPPNPPSATHGTVCPTSVKSQAYRGR